MSLHIVVVVVMRRPIEYSLTAVALSLVLLTLSPDPQAAPSH